MIKQRLLQAVDWIKNIADKLHKRCGLLIGYFFIAPSVEVAAILSFPISYDDHQGVK